jgi:phage terminase small subunit
MADKVTKPKGVKGPHRLTERQRAFAEMYVATGNARRSALAAGYSEGVATNRASQLLKKPRIRELIDAPRKRAKEETIASIEEMQTYLTKVLRGKSEAEVVVVEGQGMGVSQARRLLKSPDEKEKMKAVELLARMFGAFLDRADITTGGAPVGPVIYLPENGKGAQKK